MYFTKATKIYQFYQNCSKLNNKYEIIITLSLGTSSLVKLSPLPLNVGIYFEKPRHVIKRYFWYFYRGLVLSSRVIYRLNKFHALQTFTISNCGFSLWKFRYLLTFLELVFSPWQCVIMVNCIRMLIIWNSMVFSQRALQNYFFRKIPTIIIITPISSGQPLWNYLHGLHAYFF